MQDRETSELMVLDGTLHRLARERQQHVSDLQRLVSEARAPAEIAACIERIDHVNRTMRQVAGEASRRF